MRIAKVDRGLFLLPAIAICNMRYYYGYFVLGINIAWLKWQVIFRLGARKVKDE